MNERIGTVGPDVVATERGKLAKKLELAEYCKVRSCECNSVTDRLIP